MEELECDLVVEFVSLPVELEAAWWAGMRMLAALLESSSNLSIAETETQR